MLPILATIFVLLCLSIGGQRTAKSLISIFLNAFLLLILIFAVSAGLSPILACIFACTGIVFVTLFYQNGKNSKTEAALIAILVISLITAAISYAFVKFTAIQGFPIAQFEIQETNGYMRNIAVNMTAVQSIVILAIALGSVIDTAVCISSSLFEIHMRTKTLPKLELFWAGMNIGKNVLSSTVNTLFFIYVAEYLTLFLQFANNYSFLDMLNSKEFCQETSAILFAAIASILVIPISSAICAYRFAKR